MHLIRPGPPEKERASAGSRLEKIRNLLILSSKRRDHRAAHKAKKFPPDVPPGPAILSTHAGPIDRCRNRHWSSTLRWKGAARSARYRRCRAWCGRRGARCHTREPEDEVAHPKTRLASQTFAEYPEFAALGRRFVFRGAPLSGIGVMIRTLCDRLSRNLGWCCECVGLSCTRSRVRGWAVASTALWNTMTAA